MSVSSPESRWEPLGCGTRQQRHSLRPAGTTSETLTSSSTSWRCTPHATARLPRSAHVHSVLCEHDSVMRPLVLGLPGRSHPLCWGGWQMMHATERY